MKVADQKKSSKYALLSSILSISCVIGVLIFNYNLAQTYLVSTGKTRAMFGIMELGRLYIKLYFIPPALLAVIFSIVSIKRNELKWMSCAAILLAVISIASFFIRFWKFMI